MSRLLMRDYCSFMSIYTANGTIRLTNLLDVCRFCHFSIVQVLIKWKEMEKINLYHWPTCFPLCPYLSVKRLILEQQCLVEVVTMCQCTVLGDEQYCECFISPHFCLSWNIFNPNKKNCIYTKRCPRLSFLPRRTLKGAIEFPTNKQVDPRGFPRGSPQLWWLGYLPSFVQRGSKNSNIYSNYLDEGSRKKKGGGRSCCIHIHTHVLYLSRAALRRERRIYDE